jgi:hypothetical protein
MPDGSRDHGSAHYLHERKGLEPVVRPPVPGPTCLAWRPKSEQLLVGTREGEIFEVDPVMGTTRRAHGLGWLNTIAVHSDNKRYICLNKEGQFVVGQIGDPDVVRKDHGFSRRMSAFWHGDYAVITGDAGDQRVVLIIRGGEVLKRIVVPHRAVPRMGPDGKLQLVRSTPEGLRVQPLTSRMPPSDLESTAHVLRVYPKGVLGFTVLGLVFWGDDQTVSLRMANLGAACLSADGKLVGMGTRSGSVGLGSLATPESRAHPDVVAAFEGAVHAVEFSDRGRWLASAGDSLVVWTWES